MKEVAGICLHCGRIYQGEICPSCRRARQITVVDRNQSANNSDRTPSELPQSAASLGLGADGVAVEAHEHLVQVLA